MSFFFWQGQPVKMPQYRITIEKAEPPQDVSILWGLCIFFPLQKKRGYVLQQQQVYTTSSHQAIQNAPWHGHRQGKSPELPGLHADNHSYGIARPLFHRA